MGPGAYRPTPSPDECQSHTQTKTLPKHVSSACPEVDAPILVSFAAKETLFSCDNEAEDGRMAMSNRTVRCPERDIKRVRIVECGVKFFYMTSFYPTNNL
jgi:hypothetical protein